MRDYKAFLKETGRYILAGFLTAFVNLATFFTLNKAFSINYLISNLTAWALTVTVGFIVDKKYVFKDKQNEKGELLKFVGSRLLSLFVDQLLIWILVSFLHFDSGFAKLLDSAAVVMINYILSRKIFKKEDRT